LYDYENPEEVEKSHKIGEEILSACIRFGGTLSGEHGIGIEKAEWMSDLYSENRLLICRMYVFFLILRICSIRERFFRIPDAVLSPKQEHLRLICLPLIKQKWLPQNQE